MPCISVSDLLDYITPDADLKAREAQKKARAKVIASFNQYIPVNTRISVLLNASILFHIFNGKKLSYNISYS